VGYWHFAFLSPGSFLSAEASECAADQDAFWEFHDLIFERQAEEKLQLDNDTLVSLADELSLDTDEFTQCLESGKYTDYVRQQTDLGRQIGVQSTPAFLINGVAIIGAQPFENFKQVIDEQLNQ